MNIHSKRSLVSISHAFLFSIAVTQTCVKPLMASETTSIMSRPSYVPNINYGGKHPFEQAQKTRYASEQSISDLETSRSTQTLSPVYEPLRIVYDLEDLENLLSSEKKYSEITKINSLIYNILPQAAAVWKSTLSVVPVEGNLLIGADALKAREEGRFTNCPHVYDPIPHNHSVIGVPDADLVIYVNVGGFVCEGNAETVLPLGVPCELDQHDRPIGGKLSPLHLVKYYTTTLIIMLRASLCLINLFEHMIRRKVNLLLR